MGLLSPVPRGSKPMMSKYVEERAAEVGAGVAAPSTMPATPGPPGLTSREVDLVVLVVGRPAEDVRADRLARGVGVVERHRERGALVAVAAVGPVEVLGVELLEGGVGRLLGGRSVGARRDGRYAGRQALAAPSPAEDEAHGRRDHAEYQRQHERATATNVFTGCPRGP